MEFTLNISDVEQAGRAGVGDDCNHVPFNMTEWEQPNRINFD